MQKEELGCLSARWTAASWTYISLFSVPPSIFLGFSVFVCVSIVPSPLIFFLFILNAEIIFFYGSYSEALLPPKSNKPVSAQDTAVRQSQSGSSMITVTDGGVLASISSAQSRTTFKSLSIADVLALESIPSTAT